MRMAKIKTHPITTESAKKRSEVDLDDNCTHYAGVFVTIAHPFTGGHEILVAHQLQAENDINFNTMHLKETQTLLKK